jgi:hypothetical protein
MIRRESKHAVAPSPVGGVRRRSSPALVAWAALAISMVAMVMSVSGVGAASNHRRSAAGQIVRLGPGGRIPASLLPTVQHAREADKLNGQTASQLTPSCAPDTVDLGTWCLMSAPYSLTDAQIGKNNYFFATQACVAMGGYLPTAAQLIGAANRVPLESVIHDSPTTATVPQDPTHGLKDQREMSATLVTTAGGSDAAGSEGVSEGSTGDPTLGEPNPIPQPAVPQPETLQYVTVYDNFQKGGFAGSKPVSAPENFRCAFNKIPGASPYTTFQ